MNDLLGWRKEFPILSTTTYMISNSLGAMPRAVSDSLATYAQSWATRGVRAWEEGWWELPVKLGDKIAPLIGADPGTISLHENVTQTQAVVASCFRFDGPRRKVVLTDKQFPSVLYFWHAQQARGAEIELVRTEEDPLRVPTQKLLDVIDERTLLVPVSHVLFRSAYVQDVTAIVEKAHKVGAHVILDAYQSAGVLPIEAKKWNVDFLVGGTLSGSSWVRTSSFPPCFTSGTRSRRAALKSSWSAPKKTHCGCRRKNCWMRLMSTLCWSPSHTFFSAAPTCKMSPPS